MVSLAPHVSTFRFPLAQAVYEYQTSKIAEARWQLGYAAVELYGGVSGAVAPSVVPGIEPPVAGSRAVGAEHSSFAGLAAQFRLRLNVGVVPPENGHTMTK